jgi:hypothetical protein
MVKSGHSKTRRTSLFSMSNSDVDSGRRKNPQLTNPATNTPAKMTIRFSKLIFIWVAPCK